MGGVEEAELVEAVLKDSPGLEQLDLNLGVESDLVGLLLFCD